MIETIELKDALTNQKIVKDFTHAIVKDADGAQSLLSKEDLASVVGGLLGNPVATDMPMNAANTILNPDDVHANGIYHIDDKAEGDVQGGILIVFNSPLVMGAENFGFRLQIAYKNVSAALFYRAMWYGNKNSKWPRFIRIAVEK